MGPLRQPHKRAWSAGDEMPDPFVKGEIHEKKVMLSVWWRVHGMYRLELLSVLNLGSNCRVRTRQLLPRSTALKCKDCRQVPQGAPEARQRSPPAR
ncbi:hypothetical protein RB195_013122 [Necator americanus]|uniref:Uncharacterized protein n=1 Tax=Necator americanus TaxID=51031 RepID=A0ABR1DUA1_NECAM